MRAGQRPRRAAIANARPPVRWKSRHQRQWEWIMSAASIASRLPAAPAWRARRSFFPAVLLLAAAAQLVSCASALAEDYPTRAIRVISPYPAGSASDTVSRVVL